MAATVAWFQLACAGVSDWTRFAERLGGAVGLRRAGEVRWAADQEAGRCLTRLFMSSRERGYPVRPVDRDELGRLLPGRARVRLDDDGVRVEAEEEVLRPRTCVLAAGAEAVQVAAKVGLEVQTVSSPRRLVQTRRCRRSPTGWFFPALAGVPVDRWWLADRAMPADRLPIVGPLPWLDSLYLAVGHGGVTLAPVLGRLVAREVTDQVPDGLWPRSGLAASPSAPPR